MVSAADRYISYGFLPFCVYPDFESNMPVIYIEDPFGCYSEADLRGNTTAFVKRWRESAMDLAAKFPEHESAIMGRDGTHFGKETQLEIVKFIDKDQLVLYMPERKNLVLQRTDNYLGKCPVIVANRPGLDD